MSVESRRRKRAAVTDSEAREFLRTADPVVGRVIDGSGDLALRHAVERLNGLDHLPSEHEMHEVAERCCPYRSLAVSYLFAFEFDERSPAQRRRGDR